MLPFSWQELSTWPHLVVGEAEKWILASCPGKKNGFDDMFSSSWEGDKIAQLSVKPQCKWRRQGVRGLPMGLGDSREGVMSWDPAQERGFPSCGEGKWTVTNATETLNKVRAAHPGRKYSKSPTHEALSCELSRCECAPVCQQLCYATVLFKVL